MALTSTDLEASKKKLQSKKKIVLPSKGLTDILDKSKPEPNMSKESENEVVRQSVGEPAETPVGQPSLIASSMKPTSKKDVKKATGAIDKLQEGLTGKKVTEESKLSDEAKLAFIGLIPTVLGGIFGGEEGLLMGAQAGGAGAKEFQRAKAAERKSEQVDEELTMKAESEAEKIAVQREAIASKERLAGIQSASKLLGLKQASSKELLSRQVPGVGTGLNKEDTQILKEKKSVLDSVNDGIDRLTSIGSRGLSSLSPEQRVQAQTEVQALIGQLRIPLTGPGPLTDTEREFMENIIGNPTKIFSLSSNEQIKLDTVKSKFLNDFDNEKKVRTVEGLQQSKVEEELKRRGLR